MNGISNFNNTLNIKITNNNARGKIQLSEEKQKEEKTHDIDACNLRI